MLVGRSHVWKKQKQHFQSEKGRRVKSLSTAGGGGWKTLGLGAGYQFEGRGGRPQYLITCNVIFIYLMTLFMVQNLKIIFTADKELWQCASFGPNIDHLPQTNIFWKIIIILVYLLALSIVQNLEKLLPVDPELWGSAILQPKMTHFPKWKFFFC